MSVFNFCFKGLSIDQSGVLKSPTIIVCSAMCAWILSFFNKCGCLCIWSIDIQNWEFLLEDLTFDVYEVPLFVFFDNFGLEVDFIRY